MLNVGELGLWQQEVSKGSCAVVLDLMILGVREILRIHSVTMRGISDELVPLHGYIIPKEFNMANKAEKPQAQVQEQNDVQKAEVKSLYIKGENDKDFRTSDGFFRDPFTGEEFNGEEERVQLGTRTPRIKDSQGNIIPIAYKLWTKEEREAFKSGSSSTGSKSRSSSSKKNNELREKLLGLQEYLAEKLPNDKKVAEMIAAILPPDPEQEKLAKKVAGMTDEQKAILKSLLG